MNRIPTPTQFEKLGVDQGAILDVHLRQIEEEIAGLESGHIWTTNGLTKGQALKNVRARLRRLEKLAHDFGYWKDKQAA